MLQQYRKKLVLLAVLAIIAGIAGFAAWNYIGKWTPPRDQYPTQGVSVSESSGSINWPNVKALGADFAYVQVGLGSNVRDRNFAANFMGARKAGLRVGAMHQYSLCDVAQEQATNFVTTVPRSSAALPPAVALDFHEACKTRPVRSLVLSELGTFLNQIESHSGKPAILRISQDFEEQYKVSEAIGRTIWVTGNFFEPDYAAKPWVMWQANEYYRIRGIEGPVRWSVVQGSE